MLSVLFGTPTTDSGASVISPPTHAPEAGESRWHLWQTLVAPVPPVTDPLQRRRARIVHVAVLALLPTLMGGVLLTQLALEEQARFPLGFGLGSLLIPLFVAYRLSHTRHFSMAAWLMLGSLLTVAMAGVVVWALEAKTSAEGSLWLVLLPVGLAGVVLDTRALLLFVAATLTGLYGVGEMVPEVSFAGTLTPMGAVACLGALGVAGARLREEAVAIVGSWQRHSDAMQGAFESTLDGLPLALAWWDGNTIKRANPAFGALFGVDPKEVAGSSLTRFVQSKLPGADEPTGRDTMAGLSAEGRRDDGSRVSLELVFMGAPLTLQGPPPERLVVVRDRSAELEAASRLTTARELEARSVSARQQLLGNLRRALGEPLAALDTLSSVLERGLLDPELGAMVRGIQSHTGRLRGLANKIRMLYEVRSGQLELFPAAVALKPLLDRIRACALQARPDAEVKVAIPADPELFDSDPLRLEQALKGVVAHALRSGRRAEVRVAFVPGTHAPMAIEVRDGGASLAIEQEAALKDPLRTEGGLDLALSAAVLEHLGHPFSVHSAGAEGGTIYRIALRPS